MRRNCLSRVFARLLGVALTHLAIASFCHAQDFLGAYFDYDSPVASPATEIDQQPQGNIQAVFDNNLQEPLSNEPIVGLVNYWQQGASDGNGSGGDSEGGDGGAGAAVNPTVPLAQLQIQNLFIPSTRGASGYSNQFILQPVLPLIINEDSDFLPFHVIRPTLPIIAPTADPDGPLGTQGGLGDLSLFDLYVQPVERLKTNFAFGYTAVIPTSTDRQLGLGEWQLGPAGAFVSTAIPKWVAGAIVQAPFSTQSDAYTVSTQLIATRLLEDEWYVGWGDSLIVIDDQDGNYDIPISLRLGKVVKWGDQPLNIALQGQYTPEGFQSRPGTEWGIKLNITLLFPKAKLYDPVLGHSGNSCCSTL